MLYYTYVLVFTLNLLRGQYEVVAAVPETVIQQIVWLHLRAESLQFRSVQCYVFYHRPLKQARTLDRTALHPRQTDKQEYTATCALTNKTRKLYYRKDDRAMQWRF